MPNSTKSLNKLIQGAKNMENQKGFTMIEVLLGIVIAAIILFTLFVRVSLSEQVVSGIVYNNKNNTWISGSTLFSVRASENTVVTEENQSSYCLPHNSPYIDIINEAARDKRIKVIVTTEKVFTFVANPWACIDNVKVEKLHES